MLSYRPLTNGSTSVIFEGVFIYPDTSRLWQEVDQHNVCILYTVPTLIRFLLKDDD